MSEERFLDCGRDAGEGYGGDVEGPKLWLWGGDAMVDMRWVGAQNAARKDVFDVSKREMVSTQVVER